MSKINKTAVVTGAASGLGQATAQRLFAEGYQVTALDLSLEALEAAGFEKQVALQPCDVSSAESVEAAFLEHQKRFGAARVLVNCAGIGNPGATLGRNGALDLDEFRKVIDVNLVGSFNCLRIAAQQMQQGEADEDGERGVIINTASIAAYEGMVGQPAYAASKGGIVAMTLPIARELGHYGIRVMSIAPGVFSTPMVNGMPEKAREMVAAMRPPFPDRMGEPHEYAELVMSIVSNHLLNGEVIRLDGGLRMPPR